MCLCVMAGFLFSLMKPEVKKTLERAKELTNNVQTKSLYGPSLLCLCWTMRLYHFMMSIHAESAAAWMEVVHSKQIGPHL